MGITMNSSTITITDGNYTFEDIYQASQSAGNTYCRKLGAAYYISTDVLLGNGTDVTVLTGENISVTIEGDLFQINKNSELKLGNIDAITGATSDGCFISCPNIKLAYGFGSTNRVDGLTQSGNIFLYDSFVDIFGFWGFFGGTSQHCEVIDCLVNGFGRIEGENSKIFNVTAQKSHGRYGTLATKGDVHTFENISSKAVFTYSGHECSIYFNPEFAPGLRIIGGTYDGYGNLFYMEPTKSGQTAEDGTVTIVDAEIKNGFGAYYSDSNTKMEVRYTFKPQFLDGSNNKLGYVNVQIVDNEGTIVFDGQSDADGQISVELLHHEETNAYEKDILYYDIVATKDETSITRRYDAGQTYIDCPFFVVSEGTGTGSGDCCLDDIQTMINTMKTQLEGSINVAKSQITSKIEDEITNMGETILEESKNKGFL
jgi:hypothetical protein